MKNNKTYTNNDKEREESHVVCENNIAYQQKTFDLDLFFNLEHSICQSDTPASTGLSPIIKWPGGKEKELKYIIPNIPEFERYFEPFVGGGSVFMSIYAREYYINDFSSELIELYHCISASDKVFFRYAKSIDNSWINARNFFFSNRTLVDLYINYRNNLIEDKELRAYIHTFCNNEKNNILDILGTEFKEFPCILIKEIEKNLLRKMIRMHELELKRHTLPEKDIYDNIETAIKSALYMNYRFLYNSKDILDKNPKLHCALFFFIRNYAYSGMFRYSSKGEFNVPYGGIAYNSKLMAKKLNYYRSEDLLKHFTNTQIYNQDFEEFIRLTQPTEKDFIFLDPPYDSEFSTYAQNAFTKTDQERLANLLIYECKAKWMMIIKNTDFIYSLYNKKNINIRTFEKEYLVSFMNRNDKKVTHLLITNY